jgi:uncharacterized protein involved in exopolysaccharide biosynthesis
MVFLAGLLGCIMGLVGVVFLNFSDQVRLSCEKDNFGVT